MEELRDRKLQLAKVSVPSLARCRNRGLTRGWFCLVLTLMVTVGEGRGNPLQYSCPENPVDRGAW